MAYVASSISKSVRAGYGWEQYLTLALVRYCAIQSSSGNQIAIENEFGLILVYTQDDFLDAFRLDCLARAIAHLVGMRRWASKGARLRPIKGDPTRMRSSQLVKDSVAEYDRRRPRTQLLHDEGLLADLSVAKTGHAAIVLTQPEFEYLRVPARDISLLCHYFPLALDIEPIEAQLRAYENAIKDIFGVSVDDIVFFLVAVAARILTTLPHLQTVGDELTVVASQSCQDDEQRLRFLHRLCTLGYIRFPRSVLIERLGGVLTCVSPDSVTSTDRVERFLRVFLIRTEAQREALSVASLRPPPFVYSSSSDEVYVDLLSTLDFLAWISDRAKEWYSTQHGDRFVLAMKTWIESRTTAVVVGWKYKVRAANGKMREVDLIVLDGPVMFCIEMKAYKKSRAYFRGDPAALKMRADLVRDAVRQAQLAADAVRHATSSGTTSLPMAQRVEWLVCSPTQEYLRPLGRFGFIKGRIPRVCTPEELVRVMTPLAAKVGEAEA